MSGGKRVLRVGRLGPWHRRLSYAVLGACAVTGLGWFLALDAFGLPPPRVVPLWILHGLTGLMALLVVGAVLPMHIPVAWRHARNRGLGGALTALLAVVLASAGLLLYGQEDWHTVAHWVHVGAGIAAIVAFGLHVWRGRRSVGRMPRGHRARQGH